MSFTEPAYALPIVLDGTETLVIAFSAGVSNTVTATMTAGTYYNFRITDITDADSLTKMIDDALDAGETAASNTASWIESEPSTGLSFRMQLDRTGDTGDVVSSMTISNDALRQAMGFSELVVNNVTELSNSADDTTLEGSYQRGYLWAPRTILGRDERIPLSEVAGKITAVGRAVVDGYGQYERIRHVIEFVPGPLVYTDKAADADFQGVQVTGLALGDDTAPLDQFWRLCREGADGAPPVIKYVPDTSATSVVEDIVIADVSWLTDMDNVAEEMSPAPLLYRVRIEAMESVSTSFTSTGPTIGTATAADPTQYDTYALLPSTGTEGDWAEVTTTGAAGAYRWMQSLSSTTVKTWLRADHYRRVLNGSGWVVNGSADPFAWLTSNAGGTSTAAALPAGGWTDGSSGSGTLTDVSGNTQIDHPTASGIAVLDFNTTWPTGQVLFVLKTSTTLGTSPFAGMLDVEQTTPSALHRVSMAAGSVLNDVEFVNGAGNRLAGSKGDFSLPAFDTMFGVYQTGTIGTDDTALNQIWGSDKGFVAAEGAQVLATTTTAGGAGVRGRLFSLYSGGAARLLVQQFMAFQLGQ